MKIKPKQYAISLFESIKDKNEKEAEVLIKKYVEVLFANNDISKFQKIIGNFSDIWNKEKGIVRVEIKSARTLNDSILKEIKKYIKEKADAEEVVVKQEEDKKLLGGVIIRHGNKIIDGSARARLDDLGKEMVK